MSTADSRPLWTQVADSLRDAITRGDLTPGDRLPPENELAVTHGVSRQTTRQALEQLTSEGLLVSGRGRGRTVRAYRELRWHASRFEGRKRQDDPEAGLDAWAAEVVEQGRKPRQEVEVSIIKPPRRIAERLSLEPGEFAVMRRRARYVDEELYLLADSYFPENIARGTLLTEERDVAAPGGVLTSLGYPQTRVVDEIRCRMPTRAEAERLGLPPGTPIAEHIRTGYGDNSAPLRVMVSVLPGDRHVIVYEEEA